MTGKMLILHPSVGQRLTLEALADAADLHLQLAEHYVAYGLLEPAERGEGVSWFHVSSVRRLRTICRLREDLGINLPGIAVVLDLLERIESLKRELGK